MKKNLTDQEILAEIVKFLHIKIRDLAEMSGVPEGTLYNVSGGRNPTLPADAKKKIALTFPKLNAAFILTGEGNVKAPAINQTATVEGDNNGNINTINENCERLTKALADLTAQNGELIAIIKQLTAK